MTRLFAMTPNWPIPVPMPPAAPAAPAPWPPVRSPLAGDAAKAHWRPSYGEIDAAGGGAPRRPVEKVSIC